ncbi:MAG TPA: hypothetical protein PKV80_27110 [Leptospiraceae bacterium]|nr:hypothetical protein [Leptospiraceae bacterium]HNO26597.1 hypothetical protein [Leptospiraceae bacterium]
MKDPLDLINSDHNETYIQSSAEEFAETAGNTARALLFGISLLFTACSSVQNTDTAVLREKASAVEEARIDLDACTEMKGHDDCKEYHDKYDRKIQEYINSSIAVAEKKDAQIQKIEKKMESVKEYSELGRTVYWGAWTAFAFAVLFILGMFLWKYRLWILRALGIPIPTWMN